MAAAAAAAAPIAAAEASAIDLAAAADRLALERVCHAERERTHLQLLALQDQVAERNDREARLAGALRAARAQADAARAECAELRAQLAATASAEKLREGAAAQVKTLRALWAKNVDLKAQQYDVSLARLKKQVKEAAVAAAKEKAVVALRERQQARDYRKLEHRILMLQDTVRNVNTLREKEKQECAKKLAAVREEVGRTAARLRQDREQAELSRSSLEALKAERKALHVRLAARDEMLRESVALLKQERAKNQALREELRRQTNKFEADAARQADVAMERVMRERTYTERVERDVVRLRDVVERRLSFCEEVSALARAGVADSAGIVVGGGGPGAEPSSPPSEG